MTYQSDEISVHDAQPVELYDINLRDSATYWRYTSARNDIEYSGNTYVATAGLHRDEIDEIDDVLKTELKIIFPSNHAFSNLFMLNIPDGTLDIVIYRGHGTNFVQYWDGVIKTVNPIDGADSASVVCGPHTDALQAPFMLRTFSRLCEVPLYGSACGVTEASYKSTCSLDTVSGTTLTSTDFSAEADDYFKGGYVEGNGYKRKIKTHTTNTIVLVSAIPGLTTEMSVDVYPGCDHTRATCISKFNNLPNYRGCDWIPDEEPFTQGVYK